MSPELVERVARMLARAHFGVTGCWAEEAAMATIFKSDARYALALAERAAHQAWGAGVMLRAQPMGAATEERASADVKAAVQRAVEGA